MANYTITYQTAGNLRFAHMYLDNAEGAEAALKAFLRNTRRSRRPHPQLKVRMKGEITGRETGGAAVQWSVDFASFAFLREHPEQCLYTVKLVEEVELEKALK